MEEVSGQLSGRHKGPVGVELGLDQKHLECFDSFKSHSISAFNFDLIASLRIAAFAGFAVNIANGKNRQCNLFP